MKYSFRDAVIMALFVGFVTVHVNASVRSNTIVVELPSDLPEEAQGPSEALYLYQTWSIGELELLYLEKDEGRKLAILDVTDPGHIKALGQVSIVARSTYDFVRNLGNSMALIRYRADSGFAVISFNDYKHPVLTEEPDYQHPADVESDGANGLMLISTNSPSEPSSSRQLEVQVEVLAISDSPAPKPIARVQNVIQRVDMPQTGTIFLLNNQGVTVVRRLLAEQEHNLEILWKKNEN